jgi:hypothetical protein
VNDVLLVENVVNERLSHTFFELVDRTLLFNVKVIRVDKPNGKGGFLRG